MIELFELPPGHGHHPVFGPGENGIEWLGLDVVRLEGGEEWKNRFDERECVAVVLSGTCGVHAGDRVFAQAAASLRRRPTLVSNRSRGGLRRP